MRQAARHTVPPIQLWKARNRFLVLSLLAEGEALSANLPLSLMIALQFRKFRVARRG
jgi:hypothetical protein